MDFWWLVGLRNPVMRWRRYLPFFCSSASLLRCTGGFVTRIIKLICRRRKWFKDMGQFTWNFAYITFHQKPLCCSPHSFVLNAYYLLSLLCSSFQTSPGVRLLFSIQFNYYSVLTYAKLSHLKTKCWINWRYLMNVCFFLPFTGYTFSRDWSLIRNLPT